MRLYINYKWDLILALYNVVEYFAPNQNQLVEIEEKIKLKMGKSLIKFSTIVVALLLITRGNYPFLLSSNIIFLIIHC